MRSCRPTSICSLAGARPWQGVFRSGEEPWRPPLGQGGNKLGQEPSTWNRRRTESIQSNWMIRPTELGSESTTSTGLNYEKTLQPSNNDPS